MTSLSLALEAGAGFHQTPRRGESDLPLACGCGGCRICCLKRMAEGKGSIDESVFGRPHSKFTSLQQYIHITLELLMGRDAEETARLAAQLWSLLQRPYHIKTSAAARLKPSADLGVYIIYMEPSRVSRISSQLFIAKEYVSTLIGRDDTYQYPSMHSSLTGFFSVISNGTSCTKAAIHDTLRTAVSEFVNAERSKPGKALYCMGVGMMDERRMHDDQVKNINKHLTWVKVASDTSLVIPLDDAWWRAKRGGAASTDRITALSQTIEAKLKSQKVKVLTKRTGFDGVKAKRADHVSVLSARNRPIPLTKEQAFRTAVFFDHMFTPLPQLAWDLVVYEVGAWGDVMTPHVMTELARVPNVATQTL